MRENIPSLGDSLLGLELVRLEGWGDGELAVGDDDVGPAIYIAGSDVVLRVEGVLRLHDESVRAPGGGGVDGEEGLELGLRGIVPRADGRCHIGR